MLSCICRKPSEKSMMEGEYANEELQQYKMLADDLDSQKEILIETLKQKDKQLEVLEERFTQLSEDVKTRDNRIIDLEFEILSGQEEDNCKNSEKADPGDEKLNYWVHESEEKDKEIERLEKELTKKTCDLQAIVNKELWEKNREIEKMQKRLNFVVEKKDHEIDELKREISTKENQLKVLKEKINEVNTKCNANNSSSDDTLREKLKHSVQERKKLILEAAQLKEKMLAMKDEEKRHREEINNELKKSEKLRVESNEVCTILNKRLEELAYFLDSLLKQKSILGLLGNKQNKKIRSIIEHSLDLSRTLSLTITMNPNESLLQLSNISNLLETTKNESLHLDDFFPDNLDENLSIIPENITLTYQSHLNSKNNDKIQEQADVIKVLRTQVENLKREVEVRDNELASKGASDEHELMDMIMQFNMSTHKIVSPNKIAKNLMEDSPRNRKASPIKYFDAQSDSETWSEPDRSVSKARMGLNNDDAVKPKQKTISESTEYELKNKSPTKKNLSDNRLTINTLLQQVDLLEDKIKSQEVIINEYNNMKKNLQDMRKRYDDEKKKYEDEKKKYDDEKKKYEEEKSFLEDEGRNYDEAVKIYEEKLAAAELKAHDAERDAETLRVVIQELQKSKELLVENLDNKQKTVQNKLNELESEKMQAELACRHADEQLEKVLCDVEMYRRDLEEARVRMATTEGQYENKFREAQLAFDLRVHKLEMESEVQIQNITKRALELQEQYEAEYVRKDDMENLLSSLHELESLQEVLKITEQKVKGLEESELTLKQKLENSEGNYRDKVAELHEELDKATLQYSQAILQATKAHEEKSELESEMKLFKEKEVGFQKQVDELKNDFEMLKEKFQKQVSGLEAHKAKLQFKISELETTNAELFNKFIRLQTGRELDTTMLAPPTPSSRILDMYLSKSKYSKRQNSDMTSGSNMSESHLLCSYSKNSSGGEENSLTPEQERASPDLGIESDHGRFSSLEANVNTSRPYFEPLEISRNMNIMLDKEKFCGDECCKKVMNENNVLKDRLKHYNRLLQDTYAKLALANQRKKEVEKNISKQIHKTSQVLRKAKVNLESSGSDTELIRK